MPSDRRTFQRFNIVVIIELKLSKRIEQSFFGITNNFSFNGLCMETQCSDFEPGEDLEIRLKHPSSDLSIPVTGKVAWKNKADKFAFMMGIQLDNIDMAIRESMLDVMCSAGNVPVSFFLPDQNPDDDLEVDGEEGIDDKQIAGQEEELTMKTSMDPEDEDFSADTPEEELVDSEDPLLVEQEHTRPAGSINTSMEDDKPDHVDVIHEELPVPNLHDQEKDTLEDESDLSTGDTFHFKKEIWGRNKWIFLLITIIAAAIVIYTLPSMFKDKHNTGIPAIVTDKADYVDIDEENIPESLVADIPADESTGQELLQDVEQQTSGETVTVQTPAEVVSEPTRLTTRAEAVVSTEYYIQVGAWRNSGYAESMLTKLKQYYPHVYVFKENNLHKIRIPDIRNKQEGSRIIKDIRKKFDMNSLLVSRKK